MSEYQYYEFLALDRPLTNKQIDEVREFSSRADISSTRFVNEYHWGDFRGDPETFVTKYFDLMLYLANWGTHQLMIGLPADEIDIKAWRDFESDDGLEMRKVGGKIIVDFSSDTEEPDDVEDGAGWTASLSAIRAELLSGDLRPLYLGWLAGVYLRDDEEEEEDEDEEDEDADARTAPTPPGLGDLTPAQQALAEFLRVDEDLLAAAAQISPRFCAP